MRSLFLLLSICLFTVACKTETSNTTTTTPPETPVTKQPVAQKYTLTPFTSSTAYDDATIESMECKSGIFKFDIKSENYKLGNQTPDAGQKMCANSGKGQHIHLIMNNNPYSAKYESEFEHAISDGKHYLLAFLSRSYHESIKTPGAHKAVKILSEGKTIQRMSPITEKMVFYSRPKGTYRGTADTKKVMLDFYLTNVTLGDEYKVLADINGQKHTIDTWQPYYIEGLPMGKNSITLTLIDKEGKPVNTPLNPVTREFTLEEDPLEKEG